jgi:hypothetical protein
MQRLPLATYFDYRTELHKTMEQPIDTTKSTRTTAVSRRALLAGASKAAVPAIVTLYSGAALARSSNLISADPTPSPDANLYRCLDTSSVYASNKPNTYDLGSPPMGHVTQINSQAKYVTIGSNGQPTNTAITGDKMCAAGGSYYRKGYSGYTKVTVRKGAIVSATALSSFANNVTYTNI